MTTTNTAPAAVLETVGFRGSDPLCAIALMGACARGNVAPSTLDPEEASLAGLHPDALAAHLAYLHEMTSSLYGGEAVEAWKKAVVEVMEAATVATAFREAGLLDRDCERVLLQHGLAEVTPVQRSWTELPPSTEQALEFVDEPPHRPLSGPQNELEVLLLDANGRPLTEAERSRAIALLQAITRDDVMDLFASAVTSLDDDHGPAPDRDLTLLDALSMREMAGELFAVDGDQTLLGAIEQVDNTLNDPRYRDALLSVDRDLWRSSTDEPRVPSKHWWGVRTAAELFGGEFASEIAAAKEVLERE